MIFRLPPGSPSALLPALIFAGLTLAAPLLRATPTARVDFEHEILPLLYGRCFSCHSEKKAKPKAELKLDSVAGIREGAVIVPGKPDESELMKRIALPHDDPDRMPPAKGGSTAFDEKQIALLRRWVAEGAEFGAWQRFNHREPPVADGVSSMRREVAALTRELDRIVEAHPVRQGGGPTSEFAPIDDRVFLRRVYLDVAGRIPTYAEVRQFEADSDNAAQAGRRSALVERLLGSDGYVSHTFNWWADQLRLLTDHGGGHQWRFYEEWVKDSIRARKSIDTFVSNLVTASGYMWNNGAVGFYLRDSAMPLDHMSNLTRVFLGTRMECAQCHDHPSEPITQKDFYQLAAYTHGVSVLSNPSGYDTKWVKHWDELMGRLKEMGASKLENYAVSRAVAPLKRLTVETEAPLKFPATYAYDPVARGKGVSPQTLFGDEAPAVGSNRRAAFAAWLVSPRNPRFARNFANRLWKRVMGIGLVEPVDSLSPFVPSTDPALLDFLTRALVELRFDERAFLAMVLNSRAYQRAALREDVPSGEPPPLRGPLMRRLRAEQVWDSLLGLLVVDLDARRNAERFEKTKLSRDFLATLERMSADDIMARARAESDYLDKARHANTQKGAELAAAIERATTAGERDRVHRLREEQVALEAKDRRERDAVGLGRAYNAPETDPRWVGLDVDLIRASELDSPADHGHFLRKFGQSDRREIDASTAAPNLTQSLALMNGALTRQLLEDGSLLRRTIAQLPTLEARIEAIFLAILTRAPSARERETLRALSGQPAAIERDVIWALLNSPEFLFYP